jgi:hypothetical protein
MFKFFKKKKKEDDENILLEINYKNEIHCYEDLEKKLKNIKGIKSINETNKESEIIPDVLGFAYWDKSEIDKRIKDLEKISDIDFTVRILVKSDCNEK